MFRKCYENCFKKNKKENNNKHDIDIVKEKIIEKVEEVVYDNRKEVRNNMNKLKENINDDLLSKNKNYDIIQDYFRKNVLNELIEKINKKVEKVEKVENQVIDNYFMNDFNEWP